MVSLSLRFFSLLPVGLLSANMVAVRPGPPYQDGFHRPVNLVVLGLALHAHGQYQVLLSFLPVLYRGVHQPDVVEYLPEGWEQRKELSEQPDPCQERGEGEDSRAVALRRVQHQLACFFARHKEKLAVFSSLDLLRC